jgi:pyruvate/2-oxoglutarate dehydrogenase complex dihydrolipoamide acyltransferase (E2) component
VPGIDVRLLGPVELVVHGDINLGFVVDLSFEGLMVVVAKQADGKRLRAIAREVADLAERAGGRWTKDSSLPVP